MKLHHITLKACIVALAICNTCVKLVAFTDPPSWIKTCETLTNSTIDMNNVIVENKSNPINSSLMVYDYALEEDFNVIDTSFFTGTGENKYFIEVEDGSSTCFSRNEIILCNSSVSLGPDKVLCSSPLELIPVISDPPECVSFDCNQEDHLIGFTKSNCEDNFGLAVSFESTYIKSSDFFKVNTGQNTCNYIYTISSAFDLMQIEGSSNYAFGEFELNDERLLSSISYYHYVKRGIILFGDCFFCNSFSYDVEVLVNGIVKYQETVEMNIGNVTLNEIEFVEPISIQPDDVVRIEIGENSQSCNSNCHTLEIAGVNVYSCSDDLNNTGGTYEWHGPSGFSSIDPSVTVNLPGNYCLNYTDCNGCPTQDCIYISPPDDSCNQPTCGLLLDYNVDLCSGLIEASPSYLDIECYGTELDPSCDCPDGYTLISPGLYIGIWPTEYKLCVLQSGSYNIQLSQTSGLSVYACGSSSTFISVNNAQSIDVVALNGASVSMDAAISEDVFYYMNEGSSINSGAVSPSKMHIFNTGGTFSLTGGGGSETYAVSTSCASTSLENIDISGLVGIWNSDNVIVPSNAITYATTIPDPLDSSYDNFNNDGDIQLRTKYSSKPEECGDMLDNDFDCEKDNGCLQPLDYTWSTGAKSETISNLSPGEYCLTVTCNDLICMDCIVVHPETTNADAGPNIFSCTPGECVFIGAPLVGPRGAFYSWSTGHSGIINDKDNGQIKVCPTESISYGLTVSYGDDCSDSDAVFVIVEGPIAGSLSIEPDSIIICPNEVVDISASTSSESQVPGGYMTAFLLAQSANHTVIEINANPEFNSLPANNYTVHTFIYDPSSFDISSVIYGVTTINQIHCQLMQGGGTICGSLDFLGEPIVIEIMPEDLYIGSLGSLIEPGLYLARNSLLSDGTVANGSVMYSAGYQVELLSGFEVLSGSSFNALIESCE